MPCAVKHFRHVIFANVVLDSQQEEKPFGQNLRAGVATSGASLVRAVAELCYANVLSHLLHKLVSLAGRVVHRTGVGDEGYSASFSFGQLVEVLQRAHLVGFLQQTQRLPDVGVPAVGPRPVEDRVPGAQPNALLRERGRFHLVEDVHLQDMVRNLSVRDGDFVGYLVL